MSRGVSVRREYRSVPQLQVLQLPSGTDVANALRTYRSDPDVLYAEPNYIVYPLDTKPNDPLFPQEWGLYNTGQNNGTVGVDIGAVKAWDFTTGDPNVVVGLLDTGTQADHPDLAGNVLSAISTADGDTNDYIGHGTHTAGTIAAHGNDGIGVAGVNWQVKILPCKFINFDGGTTEHAIECLDWVASMKQSGMNVIATSNSWGGPVASHALYDAIKAQMDLGILFVAAAGNGDANGIGEDNDTIGNFPSNYDLANVIAVAATDRDDRLAEFSNFGLHSVHLGAPGVGVVSTFPYNSWQSLDGTSMATPHVSGSAALLKAYNPGLTWWQIRNLLLAGGDRISSLSQTITGNRLNVYGAMTCSNRAVESRLQPRTPVLSTSMNGPIKLSMLHINCADPAGAESVSVSDGSTVQLLDAGQNGDDVAGDGIYSANWFPPNFGVYTLTFPNGDTITVNVLKPYAFQSVASNYLNIAGTNLNLGDDNYSIVHAPFPVHFGGETFNQLYVSANGFITLDVPYTYLQSSVDFPLPYYGAGTLVAPFWDDLDPTGGGGVYWDVVGTAPNRQLVVEWRDVPHYEYPGGVNEGTVRFEVVFSESSDDVLYNYSDVIFGGLHSFLADSGKEASVGLQVGTPEATQFSFAQPSLSADLSLKWSLADPDFSLTVTPAAQTIFPGQSTSFAINSTALYDFASNVTLTCVGQVPATCAGVTITPSRSGVQTTIAAADTAPAAYKFQIQGQSSDATPIIHSVPATLNVVDFNLGSLSGPLSIADGGSGAVTLPVTASGPFSGTVTLACSGLPTGASCSFSPSSTVQPSSSSPVNATVKITIAANTPAVTQNLTITASTPGAPASKSQTVALTVTPKPDFLLSASNVVIAGTNGAATIKVAQQDGYSGTVSLTCGIVPAGPSCAISPSSISAFPGSATLSIASNGSSSGSYNVTITGTDGANSHIIALSYIPQDFTLSAPATAIAYAYTQNDVLVTVNTVNGFTGSLSITCDASSMQQYAGCYPNPGVMALPYYTSPATFEVQFAIVSQPLSGSFPLVITARDTVTGLTHQVVVQITPQTFTLIHGPNADRTVVANETSAPIVYTFTPYNGFNLPVTFDAGGCSGCVLTPNQLTPNGSPQQVSLTVTPTPFSTFAQGTNGTYQVQVAASAKAGFYPITGYSDGPVNIHVQDYELTSPVLQLGESSVLQVVPGHTVTTTFTYQSLNGFAAPVQLSCSSDIGPGLSCGFNQTSLNPGDTATLNVTADSSAIPAQRTFEVNAVATIDGHDIAKQVEINLLVYNLTIDVSPQVITVPAGGEAVYFVTTTSGAAVGPNLYSLDCITSDPGITCEHPLNLSQSGFGYVEVWTTDGVTPIGPHTFTVNVSDGSDVATATGTIVMQGDDSLILTSPNGAELWSSGTQTITWKYAGNPGSTVRLELWDRDVFKQLIADNVPLGADGTGSYQWALPDSLPFSQFYKVKIASDQNPSINDMSDTRVWMGKGVDLVTPLPGSVSYLGLNNSLQGLVIYYTWSVYGQIQFDLYKGGQFVTNLVKSDISGYFDGCYYENIMGGCWEWGNVGYASGLTPGSDYSIKATPTADPSRAVMGPLFALATASLNVTSPQPGEIWAPGSTHTISWTWSGNPSWVSSNDVAVHIVSQSSIAGIEVTPSTSLGTGGSGSITWTVPANIPSSTSYYVELSTFGQNPVGGSSGPIAIGSFNKVTVQLNGYGLVSDGGGPLYCPYSSCSGIYATGSTITLSALSGGFAGWSGPCSGTGTCSFTVTQDVTVIANFNVPPGMGFTGGPVAPLPAIHAGASAQFNVTLTPYGGTVNSVAMSCTGLPTGATCSFSQNTFSLSQPTSITVTIKTTGANSGSLLSSPEGLFAATATLGFALVGLALLPRRSTKRVTLFVCLALLPLYVSCGGGGNSGGGGGTTTGNPLGGAASASGTTPNGTYSISVNADAGTTHVSTQVMLTVN